MTNRNAPQPHAGARRPAAPPFRGRRSVMRFTQLIHAAPDRVFPLICPVREGEWAEGWKGRPVFAASGLAEENGVYVTEHEGEKEPTLWLATRHDPKTGEIELVYVVPATQIVRLSMRVEPAEGGRSTIHVKYVRTGISETGNRQIAALDDTRFLAAMREWETALDHYLATGKRLEHRPR